MLYTCQALSAWCWVARRDLEANAFMGSLPAEWAGASTLPLLELLNLQANALTGSLPVAWGAPDSFTSLIAL